ncbi:hypothetical protein H0H10_16460 [Streptomyces sp. TRM S81-3]|uniref:Secreted protein n=1 Tax=Streptomyces griseicoloratus TaxID=2752516 RepID=A0A926L5S7_9ACTN|nr:hypothetical protein [Streptomyces griseicoloratus]MBD0420717.1 hypothetical protein [Streptomyces griseicoloratus]
MGSLKVTLCAGAALAAVLTPPAHAADGSGVTVTPSTPAPGTDITLRLADCTEKRAVAVSAAFAGDVQLSPSGPDGALVGSSRIRSTTRAGAYAVQVTCGTSDRKATVTVAEKAAASPRPPLPPAAPASPVAPVEAGGGGAARLASADAEDARPATPGTAHTVTGLVLAGVAAVAVALRSVRRRGRGTD